MVLIDVEIARRLDLQVEHAVPCEQLEHVVQKADAGADVVLAAAVDRERQRNLRLRGPPVDYHTPHRTSSITAMQRFVCSTMPVAIRRHPAQPGSEDRSRR